ncbi:MAG: LysR family transcriptional regulator [Ahniella sp.]|nr:LysR family transcriptional regulator [Ahniella sp.]
MFDWNDLRVFLAIARGGSLNAAARQTGLNHSTVFRRLNALEETLKVRLFDRQPQGYRLTTEGEAIRPEAEAVEAAVHAVERKVAGNDYALRGDLRVTTPIGLATAYLAQYLPEFMAAYPGIRVDILGADNDFDLTRREADVALRATNRPPEDLVGRKVLSTNWMVAGSPAYLARHGRPGSMADLHQHALIGAERSFQRLPAFAWLHRNYADELFVVRTADLTTMVALAEQGLGLALLPSDQASSNLQVLFPMEPRFESTLWLLTHPDLRHVGRVKAFMDFMTDRLRADPRLGSLG